MSFESQTMQQKFPFPYDEVFDGICYVIPALGFKLKSSDKVLGRISASTGITLFSYGENLTITVEKFDEGTLVGMESVLKFGLNFAGGHRHQENFNELIEALSKHLQST